MRKEGRDTHESTRGSAPTWEDYLDALKIEGERYKPASLRRAHAERERKGGNPIDRTRAK